MKPAAVRVKVVRTISSFNKLRETLPINKKVALVPTMGALHEGHLSLVRRARQIADIVIVSIYINPLQFGAGEDFAEYPRSLAADCKALTGLADIVFAPDDKQMYPQKQDIAIALPPIAAELCGRSRPGFFEGVATAVCKLLNITRPDYALFGKKDYQQWILMKQMAQQLNINTKIIAGNIIRENDGLALSSRNTYLTPTERKTAPLLYATLKETATTITKDKKANITQHITKAKTKLQAAGFVIDYLDLRDAQTLSPTPTKKAILITATTIGKTRLLDNIELTLPE